MEKKEKLVLVKLGGSVITNKEKPHSPNLRNMRIIGRQLSRALLADSDLRLIIIHGGGSFGHYYAKKFGLSTQITNSASPEGLARTAGSMIKLHSVLLEELCRAGVYCGTMFPLELFSGLEKPLSIRESGRYRIQSVFENGLVPITFGYVNLEGDRSYIVSGDTIALALATTFPIAKTIFVMDVDGVYRSFRMKGSIIKELAQEEFLYEGSTTAYDVTGGIKTKINAGFDIAKQGSDVYFVNGTKSPRLFKLLEDSNNVIATKIYSTKNQLSSPPVKN
jgi:isopentenyl phosphate kinase